MPSPQKLCGESGADRGCQQRRATLEMSLPAAHWDIWVIRLWEDALLTGQELSLGHGMPIPVPCSGVGALQTRGRALRPREQSGWGGIASRTALIQVLSYLTQLRPQPSARKTLRLTSTIRAARL